jgi:hypothetical protein
VLEIEIEIPSMSGQRIAAPHPAMGVA